MEYILRAYIWRQRRQWVREVEQKSRAFDGHGDSSGRILFQGFASKGLLVFFYVLQWLLGIYFIVNISRNNNVEKYNVSPETFPSIPCSPISTESTEFAGLKPKKIQA
jgi:hypothetical protein